ncbi:MAG: serine protein kinase PrkA, partial [Polyangia bacterium]
MSSTFDAKAWLGQITADMRQAYARNRRVMSFAEYLTLFETDMAHQVRSAAQYLRDVFDHYGTTSVSGSRGALTRWQLFDCPWDRGRDSLKGQEEVQAGVYRLLSNFARQGRTNRLILLHGPNGSAKSTFVSCVQRAMEHYSSLDEGALYRFNWIFPSQRTGKGGIGFGGGPPAESQAPGDSYAYLEDD